LFLMMPVALRYGGVSLCLAVQAEVVLRVTLPDQHH